MIYFQISCQPCLGKLQQNAMLFSQPATTHFEDEIHSLINMKFIASHQFMHTLSI